jgi:hypothetical protein
MDSDIFRFALFIGIQLNLSTLDADLLAGGQYIYAWYVNYIHDKLLTVPKFS